MPEEHSLGDETPEATAPGSSPLGTPNPPALDIPAVSIIDTILQLDEFLSGDVRRAEKTARFCSKPWLEAEIDELAFELDSLTDADGNPYTGPGEASLDERPRTATQVALELQHKQAEYGAAFVSVRMAQLPSDRWQEYRAKWREALNKGAPYPNEMYDELIGLSAKTPTISADQAAQLRKQLGDPQMDVLASAAWDVNTKSGVSIPKSPLSSLVLRRAARAQS